jgi:hypothetical protein
MSLKVLQSVLPSAPCTNACINCPRTAARRKSCDVHSPCPGYGTSANCPPLIVIAVHECLNLGGLAASPH